MEPSEASPKKRRFSKNIAFEVVLVLLVLAVAFILQSIISHTKSPVLPDFEAQDPRVEEGVSEIDTATVEEKTSQASSVPTQYTTYLSALGSPPEWSLLDRYQHTISKEEFLFLMQNVYALDASWQQWFEVRENEVMIRTHASDPTQKYTLFFRTELPSVKPERYWRSKQEIQSQNAAFPLEGLRVAIDPGHIGGTFAYLEGRQLKMQADQPPVQEGDMTLIVAYLLTDQLEALGAQVTLVREKNAPVNPWRAEDYIPFTQSKMEVQNKMLTHTGVMREANRLFYRTGEIRERANIINQTIQPDVVLCLHFNAEGQMDPENPVLYENEHFHMILNGAYMTGEMALDDVRFQMVMKMLQGVFSEEVALATSAAKAFHAETDLKPYQYEPNSKRARRIHNNDFLWARNMAANRHYACPVLFYEPYLQDGKDSFLRMQAGDYEGLRYINGKLRKSIYREYVDAVTRGLVEYYTHPVPERRENLLGEDG